MVGRLDEKKMSADGVSEIPDAVTPEGGKIKDQKADLKKKVDPTAAKVADGVTVVTNNPTKVLEAKHKDEDEDEDDDEEMEESFDISSLFEGLDLSDNFKEKASLVFEAAVHEAATLRVASMTEELEGRLEEEIAIAIDESIEQIVENLDGYLDYVVSTWAKDNALAIDAGIKVEMAESLLQGMKELFYEHNIDIDEDTIDIVAELEEELQKTKTTANEAITDYLDLEEEVKTLRADAIFNEHIEGLSEAQVERLRLLSEKIDNSDITVYAENLNTLKESFFKKTKSAGLVEDLDTENNALLTEDSGTNVAVSKYESVNRLAADMKNLR